MIKGTITINGQELPIIDGKITYVVPPSPAVELRQSWNAALQRLRQPTTITWNIMADPQPYQPSGPVVDSTIEPLQG